MPYQKRSRLINLIGLTFFLLSLGTVTATVLDQKTNFDIRRYAAEGRGEKEEKDDNNSNWNFFGAQREKKGLDPVTGKAKAPKSRSYRDWLLSQYEPTWKYDLGLPEQKTDSTSKEPGKEKTAQELENWDTGAQSAQELLDKAAAEEKKTQEEQEKILEERKAGDESRATRNSPSTETNQSSSTTNVSETGSNYVPSTGSTMNTSGSPDSTYNPAAYVPLTGSTPTNYTPSTSSTTANGIDNQYLDCLRSNSPSECGSLENGFSSPPTSTLPLEPEKTEETLTPPENIPAKTESGKECQTQDCLVEYLQTDPQWAYYATQYQCGGKQCTFQNIGCGYTLMAELLATYIDPDIDPLDMLNSVADANGNGRLSYQEVIPFLENNGFTVAQGNYGDAKYTNNINQEGVLGLITVTLMDLPNQPEHWTLVTNTDSEGDWQLQDSYYGKLDCRGTKSLSCTDANGKKHNLQVNMRWTMGTPTP